MAKKSKKSELLKGFVKMDSFWGVERWGRGKERRFYSIRFKKIVYSFTEIKK